MNELKKAYYQSELLRIKRGNSRGKFINAKPLFLLTIIDSISEGELVDNKIDFNNLDLEIRYLDLCMGYEPNQKPSPLELPYYHLVGEKYYHIHWTGEPFKSSPHAHSPSRRYIRNNSDYAYLDSALWDLLQDPSVREEYRTSIVNFFLK